MMSKIFKYFAPYMELKKEEVIQIPQTIKKPKERNITIKIPEPLVREIDEIVLQTSFGYESRLEFIREAIRRHIDYIRSVQEKGEKAKARVRNHA